MRKPHIERGYWVIPRGNDLILYDPNGKEIYGQVWIRVTADVDSFPIAIMKCLVNIAKDEEEMRVKISELSKQTT